MDILSPTAIEKIVRLEGIDTFRTGLNALENAIEHADISHLDTQEIFTDELSKEEEDNSMAHLHIRLAAITLKDLEDCANNKLVTKGKISYAELYKNIIEFKEYPSAFKKLINREDGRKLDLKNFQLSDTAANLNGARTILENNGKDISFLDNFNMFCDMNLKDLRRRKMSYELASELEAMKGFSETLEYFRKNLRSNDISARGELMASMQEIKFMNIKTSLGIASTTEKSKPSLLDAETTDLNDITYLAKYIKHNPEENDPAILKAFMKSLAERLSQRSL